MCETRNWRLVVSKERVDVPGSVLFLDLLTWPDSPIEPGRVTRKQILFSPEAPACRPELAEILDRKDVKEWNKLSPVQLGLAREGARNFGASPWAKGTPQGLPAER